MRVQSRNKTAYIYHMLWGLEMFEAKTISTVINSMYACMYVYIYIYRIYVFIYDQIIIYMIKWCLHYIYMIKWFK